MPTGAEVIVEQLEDAGVEVCFGLPGVHNLALWEALRESPIRLVGVRHEQAAAYAADGYARASGKLGVALTTTGPGAANTLGAVGEAWASRTPILVIATDIPSTLRREGVYRGVLHETAGQADMFRPVVEEALVVAGASEVASRTATSLEPRRGPTYLEIPTDLLAADAPASSGEPHRRSRSRGPRPTPYPLIDAAERPLIWAGAGARDRADEVRALAERLAAPVLTTYGARGVLPPEHPCNVGMPPHVEPAGRLWDEADLVIAFGSDLDGMNTQNWLQPQPPRVIAVNLDPADARKNYDVDAVVDELDVERIRQRDGDVAARTRAVRAEACRDLDPAALRYLDAISYALPDDANVVCDMCIPGYWIAGFHGFHHPRKLQFPMGWGTLGFAFPAALGAALAGTGPTVSISGDGGFLFACGELATMAQEQLPFTAVIVDDGGYGMLRYDQQLAGDDPYGVDLRDARLPGAGRELRPAGRDRRRARRRVRRGAGPARRGRRPERAGGEGGGAHPPAHHVAELVSQTKVRGTVPLYLARSRHAAERERERLAARLDHDALARGVAGEQVDDRRRDGRGGDDRDAALGEHVAQRLDDRRLGEARADRVQADPLLGELRAERAHEPDDRVLVGAVERVVGDAGQPRERCRRDDRAAAARAQRRQRGVQAEHDAVQVGAHGAAVALQVEVVADAAAAADPRVEVHEVEPAAALDGNGDRRAVRVEVGHVAARPRGPRPPPPPRVRPRRRCPRRRRPRPRPRAPAPSRARARRPPR